MAWFDSIYVFFADLFALIGALLTNCFNYIGAFFYENGPRFIFSLQYMWKGMLCIFVVIGVIILVVFLMNFISAKAEERKKVKEEPKE